MDFKFSKSTCEKYTINIDNNWAVITIDSQTGLFQAHSDYGNFSYSWPNHGRESFKHFILELVSDPGYFLRKVAIDNYFYDKDTHLEWQSIVIQSRKEYELTKDEAREIYNIINDIDYSSAEGCTRQLYEHTIIWDKYCEPFNVFNARTGYSPAVILFTEKIMPALGEIITSELKELRAS